MKKAIGILYQGRKQGTTDLARQLTPQLQAMGYAVRMIDIRGEHEEEPEVTCRLDECDFVLVLGGDGTILHATRLCARLNIPIVGVNFGRVGFLTELEPEEVAEKLPLYLEQDHSVWVDKRSMLCAELEQDGEREEFLALNDIVIARGTWPRVVDRKSTRLNSSHH